jgi:tripeptide aminopeptidase
MKKYFNNPNEILEVTSLVKRFTEYVKIHTTSDEHSESSPSTERQFDLARKLVTELRELGLSDARVDEHCYVTATLPENTKGGASVGLIAHLDTSPAAPGEGVTPLFHEEYDGSPIRLKEDVSITLEDTPELTRCIGDTIVTSDGTTLLGADDKAGIAEIITVLEYLKENPDLPHPKIRIAFTPDEETGRGTAKFPIETFGADVAFTVDGTFDGEINVETFNADSAYVAITGVSTHPGTAKGKLVNALRYMSKFIERLPAEKSPECTEGRDGFIHPMEVNGDASKCKCHLILRDFEEGPLAEFGRTAKEIAKVLKKEEPRLKIDVEIKRRYSNMYQFLRKKPEITNRLSEAVRRAGVEPVIKPIRGGTDGANLTKMGLPCPNIFSGGMNYHGPTEFISTRSMGLAVCVLLNLLTLYADSQDGNSGLK